MTTTTRVHACAECARALAASGSARIVVPAKGQRIELGLGQGCDVHPSGVRLQASEVIELVGELPPPFSRPRSPAPTLLGVREDPAPSSHDYRGPAISPGAAMPLGPETEIATRLLAQWLADSPFEAQRGEASDQVYVSRASSIARMLLAETRNR